MGGDDIAKSAPAVPLPLTPACGPLGGKDLSAHTWWSGSWSATSSLEEKLRPGDCTCRWASWSRCSIPECSTTCWLWGQTQTPGQKVAGSFPGCHTTAPHPLTQTLVSLCGPMKNKWGFLMAARSCFLLANQECGLEQRSSCPCQGKSEGG